MMDDADEEFAESVRPVTADEHNQRVRLLNERAALINGRDSDEDDRTVDAICMEAAARLLGRYRNELVMVEGQAEQRIAQLEAELASAAPARDVPDKPPAAVAVCNTEGEPLIMTFEWKGYEWYCQVCGCHYGFFGPRKATWTQELQDRHDELKAAFDVAHDERQQQRKQAATHG